MSNYTEKVSIPIDFDPLTSDLLENKGNEEIKSPSDLKEFEGMKDTFQKIETNIDNSINETEIFISPSRISVNIEKIEN
jgi:hypothetical protein